MIGIGSRRKKNGYIWREKIIEKVPEFKYLDFMISNKGSYKAHIKELCRKGRMAAKKGVGHR